MFGALAELGIGQQALARMRHPLLDLLQWEGVSQEIDVLAISLAVGKELSNEDIQAVHAVDLKPVNTYQRAEPLLPVVGQ